MIRLLDSRDSSSTIISSMFRGSCSFASIDFLNFCIKLERSTYFKSLFLFQAVAIYCITANSGDLAFTATRHDACL
jgi:hypothetical protein